MPPYEWHNIARREDLDSLHGRIDTLEGRIGTLEGSIGTLDATVATIGAGLDSLRESVADLGADIRADRQILKFIAQGHERAVDQNMAVMTAVVGIHKRLTAIAVAIIVAIAGMVSAGVVAAAQIAAPS